MKGFGGILRTLLFCSVGVIISGCSRVDPDVVIHRGSLSFSQTPTVVPCKAPLKVTRESNTVHLVFPNDWSLEGTSIKTQNGSLVRLTVTLIDEKGNRYQLASYGEVSGKKHAFVAGFSKLGHGTHIVKLEVVASESIVCQEVLWHCYDPL